MRGAGQDDFHRVVDAGDVQVLFEVPAGGHAQRQEVTVRANANDELVVLALATEMWLEIEIARCETRQMFTHRLPVKPNLRAVPCLVNLEERYARYRTIHNKLASIPERLALVTIDSDFGERGLRHVNEAGH